MGHIIILNVHNGGHWVLMTGYKGNTLYVNDPGYNTDSYNLNDVVRAGVYIPPSKYYSIVQRLID